MFSVMLCFLKDCGVKLWMLCLCKIFLCFVKCGCVCDSWKAAVFSLMVLRFLKSCCFFWKAVVFCEILCFLKRCCVYWNAVVFVKCCCVCCYVMSGEILLFFVKCCFVKFCCVFLKCCSLNLIKCCIVLTFRTTILVA